MQDIIKQVHDVFGSNLPSRSDYSAKAGIPFPALSIMKAFKTWAKFEIEYRNYDIAQRNASAKKVVEKTTELKKNVTKKDI